MVHLHRAIESFVVYVSMFQFRLHTLIVVATQGSANSSVVVYVNVLNPNPNSPIFSSPLYTMDIFENVLPGTSIGHVSAVDPDNGEYWSGY